MVKRFTYKRAAQLAPMLDIHFSLIDQVRAKFEGMHAMEIDVEKFVRLLKDDFSVEEVEARELFRAFDIDSNGTLSVAEVVVGLARHAQGDEDDRARLVFDAFDADKRGSLDLGEMTRLFKATKVSG